MTPDSHPGGRPTEEPVPKQAVPDDSARAHAAAHRPVRRAYSAPTGRRDVDQYERALRLKTAVWAFVGVILGALGGFAAGHIFLGMILGGLFVFGVTQLLVGGAGRAAGTLHNPSGRSTPHEREYSAAESLVVRGLLPEAVEAFETAVAENPDDATPRIRLARIYRDELDDPESAVPWFRRSLEGPIRPGVASLVRRELVELYRHRLGRPRKAIPLLARWAEELSGTDDGAWAAGELAELKAAMRAEAVGKDRAAGRVDDATGDEGVLDLGEAGGAGGGPSTGGTVPG